MIGMMPMLTLMNNMMGSQGGQQNQALHGRSSKGGGKGNRQPQQRQMPTNTTPHCQICNKHHQGKCRHHVFTAYPCDCCGKSAHKRYFCTVLLYALAWCTKCNKSGHAACREGAPRPWKATPAPKIGTPSGPARKDTTDPTTHTQVGPVETWRFKPCNKWILDATKQCPGCRAPKPKDMQPPNPPRSLQKGVYEARDRWTDHKPGQLPTLSPEDQERGRTTAKYMHIMTDLESRSDFEEDGKAMLKDRKEKLGKLQTNTECANYAKDQVQIATGLQQIEELLRNQMLKEQQIREDHDEKL